MIFSVKTYQLFLVFSGIVTFGEGVTLPPSNNQFENDEAIVKVPYQAIEKRSNWALLDENKDAALVVSAMYYWSKAIGVNCRQAGARQGACYASLAGLSVASAVGLIKAGTSSGTTSRAYMNEPNASLDSFEITDYLEQLGYNMTILPSLETRDGISNLSKFKAMGYVSNNQTNYEQLPVYMEFENTIGRVAVGAPGSKLIPEGTNTTHLMKRSSDCWVSYDFEVSDSSYCQAWLDDFYNYNGQEDGDALISQLYNWMDAYTYPKYCLAAQQGKRTNDYTNIGYQNICKGELYLDAWGGEDNECTDAKDGADITAYLL